MDGLLLVLVAAASSLSLVVEVGAIAALVDAVAVALSALLSLPSLRKRSDAPPRRFRLPRWLRRCLLITAGLGLLAALLVQFLFFEPVVRLLVKDRAGVQIAFAHATGNLFTGRLALTDVHVQRQDQQRGHFDLTIATLELDLSVFGVWSDELPLDSLRVEGVRGRYQRLLDVEPGRPFRCADLALRDVDVLVDMELRAGATTVPLQLEEWHSAPFRSRWALLDCMLHSNGKGRVAGRPFTIANAKVSGTDSHESHFHVDDLPVTVLADFVGGPMRLLTGGTADVDVRDRWQAGKDEQIDLHWRLLLRDLTTKAPTDLDPLWAKLVPRLVDWLGKHGKEVPLDFHVKMEGGNIDWSSSEAARQLGHALWSAIARDLAVRAGIDIEVIEAMGKAAKNKASELLRDILQRRKK